MPAERRAVRPRNRRQLIVDAAGREFSNSGYHASSMEAIAGEVGITAAALYRHFPNKYALFAACADVLVDRLLRALDLVGARASVHTLLAEIAAVTVQHREVGGLYRWESRYLKRPDRDRVRRKIEAVTDRVARAIAAENDVPQPHLQAVGALGAIGSITMHRDTLGHRRTAEVLEAAAERVAWVQPRPGDLERLSAQIPAQPNPVTRGGQVLAAAVPLFHREGFIGVTMSRLANEVGVAPSAIYRHYPGKVDILAAACHQAAAMLQQTEGAVMSRAIGPEEALEQLIAAYVSYTFAHTDLSSVAEAELMGLPEPMRRPLLTAHEEHLSVWDHVLCAVEPGLDQREARVLAHVGFGVVVETGRSLGWVDTTEHRAVVARQMLSALGR